MMFRKSNSVNVEDPVLFLFASFRDPLKFFPLFSSAARKRLAGSFQRLISLHGAVYKLGKHPQ
jgi:hypothetical protein